MVKYLAHPRHPDIGREAQPTITFDKEQGLVLSGWFTEHPDMANVIPTERELVASIFRYVLNNYTQDRQAELGVDFKAVLPWNYCWEIPIGVEMGFDRN